jgi:hypothetical protein
MPLTFREVMARLQAQGGTPGMTARRGRDYEQAQELQFTLCRHSVEDRGYGSTDYIAACPRGGHLYVVLNHRTWIITCRRKGYHFWHPEVPPCV